MSVNIAALKIPDVKLIVPKRFQDDRGFFSEVYNFRAFEEAGISNRFCQDNHSLSVQNGTLRGLHYQAPPYSQAKLVRVTRGRILDVAVDARKCSTTFGQSVSVELSANEGNQIFVPHGFLHGFLTLEPNTEVVYKVDASYNGEADGSVRWNDPELDIDWGIRTELDISLSDKDAVAPNWRDFSSPFE